jgi:hypothetical protein
MSRDVGEPHSVVAALGSERRTDAAARAARAAAPYWQLTLTLAPGQTPSTDATTSRSPERSIGAYILLFEKPQHVLAAHVKASLQPRAICGCTLHEQIGIARPDRPCPACRSGLLVFE